MSMLFQMYFCYRQFCIINLKERYFKSQKAKNLGTLIFRGNSMNCLVLTRPFFTMRKQFKDVSGMLLLKEKPLFEIQIHNISSFRDNKKYRYHLLHNCPNCNMHEN